MVHLFDPTHAPHKSLHGRNLIILDLMGMLPVTGLASKNKWVHHSKFLIGLTISEVAKSQMSLATVQICCHSDDVSSAL